MKIALLMMVGAMMAADTPDADTKRLEGTWLVVSVEIETKPLPPDAITKRHETLTFKNGKATIKNAQPSEHTTGFKIDSTKSPKEFNLNETGDNPAKGRSFIYELNGDTLRLCQNTQGDARPKSFPTKENPEGIVITLSRQKP